MEHLLDSFILKAMEMVPIRLLFTFLVEVGAMASHLNMLLMIATKDLKQALAHLPIQMMFFTGMIEYLVTLNLTLTFTIGTAIF